ncbi:MAG: hypothetical protein V3S30_07285, partial [Thermoanaerobaculia bacterium]
MMRVGPRIALLCYDPKVPCSATQFMAIWTSRLRVDSLPTILKRAVTSRLSLLLGWSLMAVVQLGAHSVAAAARYDKSTATSEAVLKIPSVIVEAPNRLLNTQTSQLRDRFEEKGVDHIHKITMPRRVAQIFQDSPNNARPLDRDIPERRFLTEDRKSLSFRSHSEAVEFLLTAEV